jgi:hypothetical protein
MRYLLNLRSPEYATLRPAFGAYLCERPDTPPMSGAAVPAPTLTVSPSPASAQAAAEGATDRRLRRVRLVVAEQPTRLDGPEPVRRVTLHEQRCR